MDAGITRSSLLVFATSTGNFVNFMSGRAVVFAVLYDGYVYCLL